jgi:hypothetical protein
MQKSRKRFFVGTLAGALQALVALDATEQQIEAVLNRQWRSVLTALGESAEVTEWLGISTAHVMLLMRDHGDDKAKEVVARIAKSLEATPTAAERELLREAGLEFRD